MVGGAEPLTPGPPICHAGSGRWGFCLHQGSHTLCVSGVFLDGSSHQTPPGLSAAPTPGGRSVGTTRGDRREGPDSVPVVPPPATPGPRLRRVRVSLKTITSVSFLHTQALPAII